MYWGEEWREKGVFLKREKLGEKSVYQFQKARRCDRREERIWRLFRGTTPSYGGCRERRKGRREPRERGKGRGEKERSTVGPVYRKDGPWRKDFWGDSGREVSKSQVRKKKGEGPLR